MANTVIDIAGPVAGGIVVMTRVGPAAEFAIATAFCLRSMAPLFWFGDIYLGRVPTVRRSFGQCAFVADGWMCASVVFTSPMILFSTLGSPYDRLGSASGAAGVAGAIARLAVGLAIDRGHRRRLSSAVSVALLVV